MSKSRDMHINFEGNIKDKVSVNFKVNYWVMLKDRSTSSSRSK